MKHKIKRIQDRWKIKRFKRIFNLKKILKRI